MTQPSLVIHPSTGEVLGDLQTAPLEILADTYLHLQNRERQAKQWRQLLAVELEARLAIRQRTMISAGDYEIRYEAANESVWDADELEARPATPRRRRRHHRRGGGRHHPPPRTDRRPHPSQTPPSPPHRPSTRRSRGVLHVATQTPPALTVTRSLPLIPESETE
jgi:hypothetical protein